MKINSELLFSITFEHGTPISLCFPEIKTTGLAGGMHHAFKAMLPAARHGL